MLRHKNLKWSLVVSMLVVFVMASFALAQESPTVKDLLEREKEALIEAGEYTCCLMHPCTQCLVDMGMCPCGPNAVEGKPVCQECKGSWYAGDGAIEGLDPDDIQVMPRPAMMD